MSFQSPTLKQWWCFCVALVFFGCRGDCWDGSSTFPELLQSKQTGHTEGARCCLFRLQTLVLNWQPALAFVVLLWSEQVTPLMFGYCKIIWRQLSPFWEVWLELKDRVGGAEPLPKAEAPRQHCGVKSLSGTTWASPWPWSGPSTWVDTARCHLSSWPQQPPWTSELLALTQGSHSHGSSPWTTTACLLQNNFIRAFAFHAWGTSEEWQGGAFIPIVCVVFWCWYCISWHCRSWNFTKKVMKTKILMVLCLGKNLFSKGRKKSEMNVVSSVGWGERGI